MSAISFAPREWELIYQRLQVEPVYIKNKEDTKQFLLAVLWMLRSGAQWRLLPENYGKWNTIYQRFRCWSKKGIFLRLFEGLQCGADLEYVSIDATIVRAHPCSAGGYERIRILTEDGKEDVIKLEQSIGRSVGGFSTKIHALTDALGLPLRLILTKGQASDIKQAEPLCNDICTKAVLGDRGYHSQEFRDFLNNQGIQDVIPYKTNSVEPKEIDWHLYKERGWVECFFNKIKHFRRCFSRFDKLDSSYLSFWHFASALIWLR